MQAFLRPATVPSSSLCEDSLTCNPDWGPCKLDRTVTGLYSPPFTPLNRFPSPPMSESHSPLQTLATHAPTHQQQPIFSPFASPAASDVQNSPSRTSGRSTSTFTRPAASHSLAHILLPAIQTSQTSAFSPTLSPHGGSMEDSPTSSFPRMPVAFESLPATTSNPASAKRVKAHVSLACVNCKRAHLSCDVSRPCIRCINTGKQDTCQDVAHKKRGRPRLRDNRDAADSRAVAGRIETITRQELAESALRATASYSAGQTGATVPSARTASTAQFRGPGKSTSNVPRMAAFLDEQFIILKASSAFAARFGLTEQRMVGLRLDDFILRNGSDELEHVQRQLVAERNRAENKFTPSARLINSSTAVPSIDDVEFAQALAHQRVWPVTLAIRAGPEEFQYLSAEMHFVRMDVCFISLVVPEYPGQWNKVDQEPFNSASAASTARPSSRSHRPSQDSALLISSPARQVAETSSGSSSIHSFSTSASRRKSFPLQGPYHTHYERRPSAPQHRAEKLPSFAHITTSTAAASSAPSTALLARDIPSHVRLPPIMMTQGAQNSHSNDPAYRSPPSLPSSLQIFAPRPGFSEPGAYSISKGQGEVSINPTTGAGISAGGGRPAEREADARYRGKSNIHEVLQ